MTECEVCKVLCKDRVIWSDLTSSFQSNNSKLYGVNNKCYLYLKVEIHANMIKMEKAVIKAGFPVSHDI